MYANILSLLDQILIQQSKFSKMFLEMFTSPPKQNK